MKVRNKGRERGEQTSVHCALYWVTILIKVFSGKDLIKWAIYMRVWKLPFPRFSQSPCIEQPTHVLWSHRGFQWKTSVALHACVEAVISSKPLPLTLSFAVEKINWQLTPCMGVVISKIHTSPTYSYNTVKNIWHCMRRSYHFQDSHIASELSYHSQ